MSGTLISTSKKKGAPSSTDFFMFDDIFDDKEKRRIRSNVSG